jgi:alkanesulfonate monooxygenase SsuD/methylene tetrahydromethanopterin reductase-like flavin-dependent oxidoreductase (luciferase family)
VLGFSGPDEIAKKNAIYREAFASRKREDQVGFRPTEHLAALCAATVLEDREKARKVGLRGQRFFAEAIAHWYQGGPKPTVDEDLSAEDQEAILAKEKEQVVAYLSEEHIPIGDEHLSNYTVAQDAYGTPDDCIRYVQRLFDAGADEILFLFQMGGIPHDVIMETIRNIGEKVIPHFRAKEAERIAAE